MKKDYKKSYEFYKAGFEAQAKLIRKLEKEIRELNARKEKDETTQ